MVQRFMMTMATVLLTGGTAVAQQGSPVTAGAPTASLSRLSADSFVRPSYVAPQHVAAPQMPTVDEKDEEETHRWDAIKTGFYAGLIVGGIVGVALVSECGHPECGPLLTLAAGIGGAIGIGIDALVDNREQRTALAGVSAHERPFIRGRRVGIALRTSW